MLVVANREHRKFRRDFQGQKQSLPITAFTLDHVANLIGCYVSRTIGHFTVVYSVTWPMNGSEAAGDLVLIQTSLFLSCKSCCDAN